ncbi:MAG: hypothetical protein J6S14_21240 [Clostridia bacterium]|nr:hypothetical protein [Clostridia bacterium]
MPNFQKLKEAVLRTGKKNLIRISVAAFFAMLLLTMLPAAMPDTGESELPPPFSFDDKMPELDGTAVPKLFPHLVIVYPEAEGWGEEIAVHIKAELQTRFHAHFVIISDKEYLALDEATLALYNADPTLTVNLGITDLLDGTYLQNLSRIGAEGLEITQSGTHINISAASAGRVREGALAFLEAFSYLGGYNISEELFRFDLRPEPETEYAPDIVSDGEVKVLTFSHIDSNSYTLRALEGIIAEVKPNLVVFNGGVEGGAKTRQELTALWQSISAILEKTSTPWCFTPGELSGNIPRVTVCEVISSFPGCVKKITEGASYSVTVANTSGTVMASIYVADVYASANDLCDLIESETALFERASSHKRSITAILPAVTKQLVSSAEGIPTKYISSALSDVGDSLMLAGTENFICAADPASPALIDCAAGHIALSGSIGFDQLGVGGRFEYNHSLRGGSLLTLEHRRAGYTEATLSYVYAAEFGLTER